MIIEDGKGTGYKAKVDATNRVHVQSVSEQEGLHAVELGDAYNINTGNITFSAAGTLLYIKNNEDQDLVIDSIAFGMGSGTFSDLGELTVTKNITGGDLISDASAVSMNQNRNFGSSKTLTVDAYKGKSAGTATGGSDVALLYVNGSARLLAQLNLQLPKGSNIAITLDPKLSSGNVKAYCAAICYLKSETAAD